MVRSFFLVSVELPEGIEGRELFIQGEVADGPEVPQMDGPRIDPSADGLVEAVHPGERHILDEEGAVTRVRAYLIECVPVELDGAGLLLRGDAALGDLPELRPDLLLRDLTHVGGLEQLPEVGGGGRLQPAVLPQLDHPGLSPEQPDLEGGVQPPGVFPVHHLPAVRVPFPQADRDAGGEVDVGAVAGGDLDGERSILERPSLV